MPDDRTAGAPDTGALTSGTPSPPWTWRPPTGADSRNAQAKLPGPIAALDARPGARVARLAVHRDEWDQIPRRLPAGGRRVVRAGWPTTIRPHTVSVTTVGSRLPITLLAAPSSTPPTTTATAMDTAATRPGTALAADILAAEQIG